LEAAAGVLQGGLRGKDARGYVGGLHAEAGERKARDERRKKALDAEAEEERWRRFLTLTLTLIGGAEEKIPNPNPNPNWRSGGEDSWPWRQKKSPS